ncbi:MAG: class I SAM-dependent methyltransferase [Deltaproteobacteria bacterium]|nr:class I SAM-dependent methyltransferase [Deltaproteobacteria bacterium]
MEKKRFDPKKLQVLNDPARLLDIPPEAIWQRLSLDHPEVLVDIGAGTGLFSASFARYVPDGKLYALDIAEVMVDWMKENVCPHYPQIIAMPMKDSVVPLADGVADLVIMINLHHELDKPEAMVAESFRLLKKQGRIAIVDWKKEAVSEGPPAHLRCTPEEVEQQLRQGGFRNVEIYRDLPKHFLVIAEK